MTRIAESGSVAITKELEHQHLIPEKLWDRIVGRLKKDYHFDEEKAELILGETLCFLKMCSDYPNHQFAPSKLIDVGWHMFLLYTRGYQEFCYRVNGGFIHHEPNDGEDADLKKGGVRLVVQFMQENSIPFHKKLWLSKRGVPDTCKSNCSKNCTPDPNCTVDCKDDCR